MEFQIVTQTVLDINIEGRRERVLNISLCKQRNSTRTQPAQAVEFVTREEESESSGPSRLLTIKLEKMSQSHYDLIYLLSPDLS